MKKFVSVFICTVFIMMTFTVSVNADVAAASVWKWEGDYYYSVENKEATIESFYGEAKGVIDIPDELGGYPVVRINDYVYYGEKGLTGADIPKTVRSLGSGVFYATRYYNDRANWTGELLYMGEYLIGAGTLVGKIKIKDGVKCVADGIFDYARMTELQIPKTVEYLGDNMFLSCYNLKKITVEADNENYCSDESGNLFTKNYEKLIKVPEATTATECILPKETKVVGDSACANTGLRKIVLPEGLSSIGTNAFENTDIDGIKLPSEITEIPDNAFRECENLRYIIISGKIERIGYYALNGCTDLNFILFEGWHYGTPIDIFNGNEAFDRAEKTYGYKEDFTADVPPVEMLTYGDRMCIEIIAINGLSENSVFSWRTDSEAITLDVSEDGKSCTVKPSIKGKDIEYPDIFVTATDENGNEYVNEIYLKVDCRWYQKILSFFRMIFGLTTIIYC